MNAPVMASIVMVEWPVFNIKLNEYQRTVHKGTLTWMLAEGALVVEQYAPGSTMDQIAEWDYLPGSTYVYPMTSVRRFRTEPAGPNKAVL